jgi:hypothetical protein
MHEIISRQEAIDRGITAYFTGESCPNGHISTRNVRSRGCHKCAAENEKRRRIEKPETYKHRYRSYQDRNPERCKASGRAWKERNRERSADAQKARAERLIESDPKKAWAIAATSAAKRRGARVGVPVNLTREYIYSLCQDHCPVLGMPLVYVARTGGGAAQNSATIDRVIPALGYVVGNVAIISHRANSIKRDATPDELAKVAAWARLKP